LSLAQAAALAAAALLDTLAVVERANVSEKSIVLDGRAGPWLPAGLRVLPQRSGPFPLRLAGAISDAFAAAPLPVLLIGMDTPQLTVELIEYAATQLTAGNSDVVLGLAEDGGFWTIGTRSPIPGMFDSVEMSTAQTGHQQLERLGALHLRCAMLPTLRDVDLLDDAIEVARLAPNTRFAAAVSSCTPPRNRLPNGACV
jgi:glycosyltransferase A (GT-A) superfamily protein (DUF2064 family)